MTNSSGKVVIYSGVCSNGTYSPSDGVPMQIDVSQMTVQARPMTSAEIKKGLDYVNKSITVTKALIEIGKSALLFLKDKEVQKLWKDRLEFLAGVGDIVKGVLKMIPGPPNPMIEKLQHLVDQVEKASKTYRVFSNQHFQLGELIKENFDELKMLITEVDFFIKIMCPTTLLLRYMRDCIKNPGPEAVENFKKAYKKHPTWKLAYDLESYLERHDSNPLRVAMDAESGKTKATYQKWDEIITRVLSQFLYLEAFAIGLLKIEGQANYDLILSKSETISETMKAWKDDYMKNQGYWDEMKTFLPKYMSDHTDVSVGMKGYHIKQKLDTYLTSDSFYVCVFKECSWEYDYAYYCYNEATQMIGAWNIGGCHAFIYRSHTANDKSEQDFKDWFQKVENCRKGDFSSNGKLPSVLDEILDKQGLHGCGFIGLVDHHGETQASNCEVNDRSGPGAWNPISVGGTYRRLIIAFP